MSTDYSQAVADILDALGDSPTPDEAYHATRNYDERYIAAALAASVAAGGGGGGSLPTGWVADSPGPGELSLGDPVSSSSIGTSGVLKRPDGTAAIAFDGNGRVEFYYGDGETLAFAISAAGEQTAIEFHKTNPDSSTPILKWDDDARTWICQGDFQYAGNDPLFINGGGLNMSGNDITGRDSEGGVSAYAIDDFKRLRPAPAFTPELPAIPTAQDIVDALLALQLVTQAT